MSDQVTENQDELSADLEQQLADIDRLGADDFSPPAESPGDQQAANMPDSMTATMCANLLAVLFAIMAGRRGEHWNLTEAESEQLGAALGAVLDKYMPGFEAGPEAVLLMVTLLIVMPRVGVDAKLNRERREKEQPKATTRQERKQQPAAAEPEKQDQPSPGSLAGTLWTQDKAA